MHPIFCPSRSLKVGDRLARARDDRALAGDVAERLERLLEQLRLVQRLAEARC